MATPGDGKDQEGQGTKQLDDKSMEDENPVADHPKKQMRSMQRYYHMGSFFQQDADNATQTAGAEGEGDEGEELAANMWGPRGSHRHISQNRPLYCVGPRLTRYCELGNVL